MQTVLVSYSLSKNKHSCCLRIATVVMKHLLPPVTWSQKQKQPSWYVLTGQTCACWTMLLDDNAQLDGRLTTEIDNQAVKPCSTDMTTEQEEFNNLVDSSPSSSEGSGLWVHRPQLQAQPVQGVGHLQCQALLDTFHMLHSRAKEWLHRSQDALFAAV